MAWQTVRPRLGPSSTPAFNILTLRWYPQTSRVFLCASVSSCAAQLHPTLHVATTLPVYGPHLPGYARRNKLNLRAGSSQSLSSVERERSRRRIATGQGSATSRKGGSPGRANETR